MPQDTSPWVGAGVHHCVSLLLGLPHAAATPHHQVTSESSRRVQWGSVSVYMRVCLNTCVTWVHIAYMCLCAMCEHVLVCAHRCSCKCFCVHVHGIHVCMYMCTCLCVWVCGNMWMHDAYV